MVGGDWGRSVARLQVPCGFDGRLEADDLRLVKGTFHAMTAHMPVSHEEFRARQTRVTLSLSLIHI